MASHDEANRDAEAAGEEQRATRSGQAYVWGNDEDLTDYERALKQSVLKRRERQKRSYQKKKLAKQAGTSGAGSSSQGPESAREDDEQSGGGGDYPQEEQEEPEEQMASEDNGSENQGELALLFDGILDDFGSQAADNSNAGRDDSGTEDDPLVVVREYYGYDE